MGEGGDGMPEEGGPVLHETVELAEDLEGDQPVDLRPGGDQGLGGEVVDGAGQAAGGVVDQRDGVVAEQRVGAAGELEVTIGGVYPLSEAARAHRDLIARRSSGKLLLDPLL